MTNSTQPERPSRAVSIAVFVVSVSFMAWLRLWVFGDRFVSLTYALPLLLCLWQRDRVLLWSMSGAFVLMATVKAFWLMPDPNPNDWTEAMQWAMQVINILVVAVVVHGIVNLRGRLSRRNQELEAAGAELREKQQLIERQNYELEAQAGELANQNAELQEQSEELAQQGEELQQQTEELQQRNEELEVQSEELRSQAEELQRANAELGAREGMLQRILDSLRGANDEREVLTRVCQSLVELLGAPTSAAAVVERVGEELLVRTHVGIPDLLRLDRWLFADSFASIVMEEGKTGFVEDLLKRPDLQLPEPKSTRFRSILASPIRVRGISIGTVEAYAADPRKWTSQDFRIIEWVASQCSLALEILRLQNELRLHRERLQWVLDSTGIGLWLNQLPLKELNWDRRTRELFFVPESAQPTIEMFWGRLHPDDREPTRRAIEEALAARTPYAIDHRVVDPETGTVRWVHSAGHATYGKDGSALRFDGINYDVTETKRAQDGLAESESRFRIMADGTPVLIWVHGPDGRLNYINRAYREFFGVTIQQVCGNNWKPLVHPDDAARYVNGFLQSQAARKAFRAQARVRRHDGAWRWIESYGEPRFSDAGEFLGMAGSSADITERKEFLAELERQVAERTKSLEETTKQLNDFCYSIAHDLKAPIRAQAAFARVVLEDYGTRLGDEGSAFVKRIEEAAQRQGQLVSGLLTHISLGRSELPLEPVDLPHLIGLAQQDLEAEAQAKGATIHCTEWKKPVIANPASLHLVFSNLLSNAIKFVAPGTRPDIKVIIEQQNGFVRVCVQDNGIGIPMQHKDKLFGVFQRLHPQELYPGTGIGLAIVKRAVERMGGRVGVESEPGKGSRFWVELKPGPAQQARDEVVGI